jgi:hypothetical protein
MPEEGDEWVLLVIVVRESRVILYGPTRAIIRANKPGKNLFK